MPLTEKGETIKTNMTKEYGEKKGEEVFYASKNAGKIKGVDAMTRLPTIDVFRKKFKDAFGAGMPLSKCLNVGTTWGTAKSSPEGNTKKNQAWQSDSFRSMIRDSIIKGMSADKAIRVSLDAIEGKVDMNGTVISGREAHSAAESGIENVFGVKIPATKDNVVNAEEWPQSGPGAGEEPDDVVVYQIVLSDKKASFKDSVKDAIRHGKSYKDAIRSSLDCNCKH